MILYNSKLAKLFLGKKKHYFMLFGCCFTRFRYLEGWEEMELRIHEKQFSECFLIAFLPALVLSILFSWWWILLAFGMYHLLYWFERIFWRHSVFNWEALKNCGDSLYLRKRKSFFWLKYYGKSNLPHSGW